MTVCGTQQHTYARFAVAMGMAGFTGKAVLYQSSHLAAPDFTVLVERLWVLLRHSAMCSKCLATSLNLYTMFHTTVRIGSQRCYLLIGNVGA